MKYFQNIEIIIAPKSKNKVVFQCDENYFNKFGIYNLLSCNKHKHDVHLHLINPSELLLDNIKNLNLTIDLSISKELLELENINFYKLKSYYFCSRYFIADYLFAHDLIQKAYITDADVIFNENISFDDNVNLGILYYPYRSTPWKQTGANFLYVTDKKKQFVKNIVNLYNEKVETINFNIISEDMDKMIRANMYGLDQVCMSALIKDETDFLNVATIDNFVTKQQTAKIWSLTGPWKKDPNIKTILENHIKYGVS